MEPVENLANPTATFDLDTVAPEALPRWHLRRMGFDGYQGWNGRMADNRITIVLTAGGGKSGLCKLEHDVKTVRRS
jgi:hypothetical protein